MVFFHASCTHKSSKCVFIYYTVVSAISFQAIGNYFEIFYYLMD